MDLLFVSWCSVEYPLSLSLSLSLHPITAIIINNRNFTCGMKDRVGTDIDANSLTKLCNFLGFYTNRYDNLRGADFKKRLRVSRVQ